MSQPTDVAGAIHDIGYRRYAGRRLGPGRVLLAMYAYSLGVVFGLGRPANVKAVPFGMLTIICVPALVTATAASVARVPLIPYESYLYYLQLPIMVFVAAQAAELVTDDVRHRVLPLYFSRPLTRDRYALAKLAALGSGTFIVMAAPMVLIYLVAVLSFTHSFSDAAGRTGDVLLGLAGAATHAIVLGALALAVAAFTRRYVFAVLAIVGSYLVSVSVLGIVAGSFRNTDVGRYVGLVTPFELLSGFDHWLLRAPLATGIGRDAAGWTYAAVTSGLVAVAVALLLWRYRSVET